ncbi:hypothetical protein ACFWVC_09875 [Streptomyces sp. NPDC058691]|uniref:hypothetical protein n=1 Tax=Streptomyces sp. NPDC058691 TaxID=3346601 RepID=UPI003661D3CA
MAPTKARAFADRFDAADATRREAPADGFDDRLDEADIQALNAIWAELKRKASDAA